MNASVDSYKAVVEPEENARNSCSSIRTYGGHELIQVSRQECTFRVSGREQKFDSACDALMFAPRTSGLLTISLSDANQGTGLAPESQMVGATRALWLSNTRP